MFVGGPLRIQLAKSARKRYLLVSRLPILDDRDGRGAGVFRNRVDHERLAVGRNHVGVSIGIPDRAAQVRARQLEWLANFEPRRVRRNADGHCHQATIRRNIEPVSYTHLTLPTILRV